MIVLDIEIQPWAQGEGIYQFSEQNISFIMGIKREMAVGLIGICVCLTEWPEKS